MIKPPYTLITGASQGIGKAFAHECASRGMNLLLVALPGPRLEETKEEITARYAVNAVSYGVDLTEPNAVGRLYDYCIHHHLQVNVLINNAGAGAGGLFENLSSALYLNMIRLNVEVMTLMTHQFLPMLKKQGAAYILNMSSMEATLPLPYKAVYTGTKNYIFAFSLALREELAGTQVGVSVLCPGPVLTNSDGLKRMNAHGSRAKLIMLMPAVVARIGIEGLMKRKGVIIPGKTNWSIVKLMKLIPTPLKMKTLERLFRVYRAH